MILDRYFKRPIFWDYLISIGTTMILIYCFIKGRLSLPEIQDSYSLTGDLTNIALTLAGFILTILTLLITFKDSSGNKTEEQSESAFKKFFSTNFYFETVKHLKNCIKSIVVIAALGFLFKLFLLQDYRKYLFFYNVFGLIITILSVNRCLLILSQILKFQKDS